MHGAQLELCQQCRAACYGGMGGPRFRRDAPPFQLLLLLLLLLLLWRALIGLRLPLVLLLAPLLIIALQLLLVHLLLLAAPLLPPAMPAAAATAAVAAAPPAATATRLQLAHLRYCQVWHKLLLRLQQQAGRLTVCPAGRRQLQQLLQAAILPQVQVQHLQAAVAAVAAEDADATGAH